VCFAASTHVRSLTRYTCTLEWQRAGQAQSRREDTNNTEEMTGITALQNFSQDCFPLLIDTARRTGRKARRSGSSGPVSHESVQSVHNLCFRRNAVFRTEGRPVARDGSDRAVESGRPPTGRPVRSDREKHCSSRVTWSFGLVPLDLVPLREERTRSSPGPACMARTDLFPLPATTWNLFFVILNK
jgi:hypothetical protein